MLLKQIIDVFELLDDSRVDGAAVVDFLKAIDPGVDAETHAVVFDYEWHLSGSEENEAFDHHITFLFLSFYRSNCYFLY